MLNILLCGCGGRMGAAVAAAAEAAGDRIVVDGTGKLRPGLEVTDVGVEAYSDEPSSGDVPASSDAVETGAVVP